VEKAFDDYKVNISNRIFLTHQSCMSEILRVKGGQHYPIPHLKKASLERRGLLPVTLSCDPEIVRQAVEYVT